MRIAVDISPIDESSKSAHKVRGVGRYISLLRDNLEKFDKENTYIFTSKPQETERVDIIHYPYFDPFFVTLPYINKVKTVVTVHDLIPITHKKFFPAGVKGNFKWQINKILLSRVDAVITDSIASKNAVTSEVNIADKKIFPVLLCVDKKYRKLDFSNEERSKIMQKYNLPDEFFLYVGDVTWNKNLPRIVESIKKVNIPLVMVGKALTDDFDRRNVWNGDRLFIEKNTNSDLFIKTGYVSDDDLVKIYNISLGLIMPSLNEGFGLPVLEAMSCGCPVITSSKGSLPEVGGDAVLYADAENSEDIAKKVTLLMDKKNRQNLVEKGLMQSKKFSAEKFIEDTIHVYQLINGKVH